MSDNGYEPCDAAEPGSWLPLRDAARALGIPENLATRFAGDGKLRSRDRDDGRIEVWVDESDRLDKVPLQPLEVIEGRRSLALAEHLSAIVQDQAMALMAPLAGSYERNVQLARENGVLTERLAALERELRTLRDASASEGQALAQARKRIEALEGANVGLTRMLSARSEEHEPERGRRSWTWLLYVIGAVLCGAAAVLWYLERLR